MNAAADEFLPTRLTLLNRLRRWDDQESWRDFFNTYWKLIYGAAVRAGLSHTEAEDVVQDTVIAVARKMEQFRYDPAVDSFKGWLLYLTRKQVALQYRRRDRERNRMTKSAALSTQASEPGFGLVDANLEAHWNQEWERNLWNAAIERVKAQTAARQFQMFDLYVIKEQPATDVAQLLGVPVAQVYLAKHRISALVKKELHQLKTKLV